MNEHELTEIKNYMEICVEHAMPTIMEAMGTCTCDLCKLDIMAISLNSLPPKYIVTNKGMMYSKLQKFEVQFNADVVSAITKACEIVRKHPRHEE